MLNLKWKAAQLSLVRQMESISFIKEFIAFLADNHYNALLLGIDNRIRTPSCSRLDAQESYTPRQMRDLVEYALQHGVEIVPYLSTLGHNQRFLQSPELAALSELSDGQTGRFHSAEKSCFCPSREETYRFFSVCLAELAEIFPAPYFHVGHDEVWDMGYCGKCAEICRTFDGEQKLFLRSILRYHEILRKLGKRMMIWDDMFESFTDILPEVPRDVILVNWEYQDDVNCLKEHWGNMRSVDPLKEYDRLGFEYVIAPSDFSIANIATFSEYAGRHRPWGGLVACWGKQSRCLYRSLPAFAFAGHLWSGGNCADAWRETCGKLFHSDDPKLSAAVRAVAEKRKVCYDISAWDQLLLCRPVMGLPYAEHAVNQLLAAEFAALLREISFEPGRRILADLSMAVRFFCCMDELAKVFQAAFSPASEFPEERFETLMQELSELGEEQNALACIQRPDISSRGVDLYYRNLCGKIRLMKRRIQTENRLVIRFCRPCQYSVPYCKIRLLADHRWTEAASGVFASGTPDGNSMFERVFPVSARDPEAVEFEVSGYGGLGICDVKYYQDGSCHHPVEIRVLAGEIYAPDHLLRDDCRWTYLGNQDSMAAYRDRSLAERKHILFCQLRRQR